MTLPEKISKYAPYMKHYQKAYLRSFPSLNLSTSLYLVNIQPNLKLHPPTKTFWIRSR